MDEDNAPPADGEAAPRIMPRAMRFARAIAAGVPAEMAWTMAGFKPQEGGAAKLLRQPAMQRAIEACRLAGTLDKNEIRRQQRRDRHPKLHDHMEALATLRDQALANGNFAAAVAAEIKRAELGGAAGGKPAKAGGGSVGAPDEVDGVGWVETYGQKE